MRFPRKTPLLILALLAGLIVLLVVAPNAFVAHSITQMEREHARQHIVAIRHIYDNELANLAASAADWANWDDTYQFMVNRNEDYLTTNYTLEAMQTLDLAVAMLVDMSGQVIFSKAYNAQAEREAPLPTVLLQGDFLTALVDSPRSLTGLLDLPEGRLILAAEPILTSTRTGPPRGILLFGRWLNNAVLTRFENIGRSEISLFSWQADNLPADFVAARQGLSGPDDRHVRVLNDRLIAAYLILPDLNGKPAVILRAVIQRAFYQRSLVDRALFTTLLLVFAGSTGLVIVLLMVRMLAQGQELSAILNGSADPIAVVFSDGTIQKVNTAFEATCGLGMRSLLDVVCPEHPEHKEALQQKLHEAVTLQTTQNLVEVSFRCQSAARETNEFEVVLSPIRTPLNRSPRLIVTLHDLALQKQMEAHLRGALDREIEINRLKNQFLAVASHEFRTPLAVIQSSTDLLDRYWDRQNEAERHKRFEQIRKAVQSLQQLTDDLLTHIRTETGAVEVRLQPVDLNALCQHIVSEMTLAYDGGVTITLQLAPQLQEVSTDPGLVTLVVRNLLSNAIKYSAPGKAVSLSVAQGPEGTLLTIRDKGMGIPREEQPYLFTPFFRASNARQLPGTGLGLSIVRRAVELLGGTVTFESVPGQGTTFCVTLPHGTSAVSTHDALPQPQAEVVY